MMEVLSKEGRLVLIEGETGIGKTALAQRFMEVCKRNGFTVLAGRCRHHGYSPYQPFKEALEGLDEKEVDDIYKGVAASFGNSTTTSHFKDFDVGDKRGALFLEITERLIGLSKDEPLLIFLDDLQWIDISSAKLLHFLKRNLGQNRIFVIGAYRLEDVSTFDEEMPIKDLFRLLDRERDMEIISLDRLGKQGVRNIICNILDLDNVPSSFVDLIYKESEGNPYYVHEIMNSLLDEGLIDLYSFRWDPNIDLSKMIIPKSIESITRRKVDRLDRPHKTVLSAAAVMGDEFDFEVIEKTLDMDIFELLDILDQLIDRGFITEVSEADKELYRFNHIQTRSIIYRQMGKTRRRVLHRNIARSMDEVYSKDPDEHYAELSLHFFKGGLWKKAYEYSLKASDEAISSLALDEAIMYLERASESLDQMKEKVDLNYKKELYDRLSTLYIDVDRWDEALEVLDRIKEIASEKDLEIRADAEFKIARCMREMQDFHTAEEKYTTALEMYGTLEDEEGIARCHRGLGHMMWRRGRFGSALSHFQKAEDKARSMGNNKILATVYMDIGNTLCQSGASDEGLDYYKQSISILEDSNHHGELARAYNNMGDEYMDRGEIKEAIDLFQNTITMGEKAGSYLIVGWGSFNLGLALAKGGEIKKALDRVSYAENILTKLDHSVGLSSALRTKATIYRLNGEHQKALGSVEKAMEILVKMDIPFNLALCMLEKGKIQMELDDTKKAEDLFREAEAVFRDLNTVPLISEVDRLLQRIQDGS